MNWGNFWKAALWAFSSGYLVGSLIGVIARYLGLPTWLTAIGCAVAGIGCGKLAVTIFPLRQNKP